MDATSLRAAFPVLAETAYLNAGTCGPLASATVDAGAAVVDRALRQGRGAGYFEQLLDVRPRLRSAYAALLGAAEEDVALTTSTSEGLVRVLAGLDLGPGDEILTAPDEHPGLLGPLLTLRARRGVSIRTVAFERLGEALGPDTRLVACSHVNWVTGALAPAELGEAGVPLLLDGAQGVGAVATDVTQLGCDFYAGAGQKWLCGPMGTGMLWVSPAWRARLPELGATYLNLEEPSSGLQTRPHDDARRHDAAALAAETLVMAAAAHDVLAAHGWDAVHARAAALAAELADALTARGRRVATRGPTTLVTFEDDDPDATRQRLAQAGVLVRSLPGTRYLRASVGAWNDSADLDRLLAGL